MKKLYKRARKPFALFGALLIALTLCGNILAPSSAASMTSQELAAYINAQTGLTVQGASGAELTVSGSKTNATATLSLEIPAGITVNWEAAFSGSTKSGTFLLYVKGGGTFNFISGSISNAGAGGQINASGVGMTINIRGTLFSNTTGISLNIADNDIKLNVTGAIENTGSSSAININPGLTGVVLNIGDDAHSGSVISRTGGYAINDGGGTDPSNNKTEITIINGSYIETEGACAIRSTGKDSNITIIDSTVMNSAGSSTNSTIYMNCGNDGTGGNVTIGGNSVVKTLNESQQSYVIQATGNVTVKDSATVSAINGRAINLVGMNSTATILGGVVETANGTAVSTATTNPETVENSKIYISGGIVQATGTGTAVRITGAKSEAVISGGWVTARSGMAVDASGSSVANSVKISGGFVFAWGNGINKVVTQAKLNHSEPGVITAWNTTTGTGVYNQLERTDLQMLPDGCSSWDNGAPKDGISYANGSNTGFFPLDVTVITTVFTLTIIDGTSEGFKSLQVPVGAEIEIKADDESPVQSTSIIQNPLDSKNVTNGTSFNNWTSNTGGAFGNEYSSITTFTMPAANTTITANYTPRYLLTITSGVISSSYKNLPNPVDLSSSYGYYPEGAVIIIEGNTSPTFVRWNLRGHSEESWRFADNSSRVTTFTMPGERADIEAMFTGIYSPVYNDKMLIVENGAITGTSVIPLPNVTSYSCQPGTTLYISADEKPGYIFDKWVVTSSYRAPDDISSPNTFFLMPDEHVTIEATYKQIFALSVEYDTSTRLLLGFYPADEPVSVTAPSAQSGMLFCGWTSYDSDGEFDNASELSATFTMPGHDAVITTNYEWIDYSLTIIGGTDYTGAGIYHTREEISIVADTPEGMDFTGWVIISGNGGSFASVRNSATTFTMPADNVTIIANFANRDPIPPRDTAPPGNNGGSGDSDPNDPTDPNDPSVPDDPGDPDDPDDPDDPGDPGDPNNPGEETKTLPPTSIIITAATIVSGNGAILTNGQFSFAIYDKDDNLVATSKNSANGEIEFEPINFTQAGTYTFKIVETSTSSGGWITDGRVFIIIVIVTEDDIALSATVIYPDDNIPMFHNRYSTTAAAAEDSSNPMPSDPFTQEHIAYIIGYPDGTVRPGQYITRAEVATVFYRLLTGELRDYDSEEDRPFSDVNDEKWYSTAVIVMHNLKIIEGYPDGTFRPDSAITRAELATIASHFAIMMRMTPINHQSFSDVSGHWAESEIEYAAEIGWVNGYPDGTYGPSRSITRAEFITLTNRVLGREPETAGDLLIENMIRWVDNADPDIWYYLAIQEATNSHIPEYKEGQIVPGLKFEYEYWKEIVEYVR